MNQVALLTAVIGIITVAYGVHVLKKYEDKFPGFSVCFLGFVIFVGGVFGLFLAR